MSVPVHVGDILAGKYLVERVLGAGGMGVVVAAKHLQLDERVAIKFLLPESLQKGDVVARFLREGRLNAKIRSDHVARVRDVGTLESGAPYLVLEYLDGIDLNELVRARGPLPVERAVEYILQVSEALAEAHSIGIIHRDLKPANLFLTTRSDGSTCIKLIDFGISKLAASAGSKEDLTRTLEIYGSPRFMSPEQLTASLNIDTRSDIWALGVTLHYLLTGKYPFDATAIPELCGKVLHSNPTPLRTERPDAPETLAEAILNCLRKSPEERYLSVADFSAAIVDLAPQEARLSAVRIAKILRITPRPDVHPSVPHVATAPPIAPPASTIASRAEDTDRAAISSQAGSSSAESSSWARTSSMSSGRRRSMLVIALAALALLSGSTGAVLLSGSRAGTARALDGQALLDLRKRIAMAAPSVMPTQLPTPPASVAANDVPSSASASSAARFIVPPNRSVPRPVGASTARVHASTSPAPPAPPPSPPPAVKLPSKSSVDLFDTSL